MNQYPRQHSFWLGAIVCTTILLVGVAVFGQSTIKVPSQKRRSAEDRPEKPLPPSQAIPISTLKILVDSPVPSISSAALALANKRMISDITTFRAMMESVRQDITSQDRNVRRQTNAALKYLEEHVRVTQLPPDAMSSASTTSPASELQPGMREQDEAFGFEHQPVRHVARTRIRHAGADMARRRQRREAMLFHEGSGELSEGDIIELNVALAEIVNTNDE